MRLSFATRAAAFACLSALTIPSAGADDFYKGKTLNIVAGYTPGGGFDANARLLSRHIAKHIPGKPDVERAHAVVHAPDRKDLRLEARQVARQTFLRQLALTL
jgi:hypothetical protein